MLEITGTTHQPSSIAQHRVDHFSGLALAIDANATLPIDNLLRTDWVLRNNYEASQARAFGACWWTHMTTGYSYFLNQSFLAALEPSVDASLSFEDCISGLRDVLSHLQSLSGDDHHHATDGMSLARARARFTASDVNGTRPTQE
ncbi:hypothetical protein EUA06_16615 [Nocardioides glacieisoli]|uniref:Uncharacterized protein n=1 Tax=Nocardioides glacieisoli TaxID=1168730 RepID=A0A4V1RJK6_9ACTN|nr:hypothetical protein [Nocardioides glacieisoli]RYB89112.1 hypothetical protein EUA06_16615 [Nocardioides glacieisoli]